MYDIEDDTKLDKKERKDNGKVQDFDDYTVEIDEEDTD